MVMTRVVGAVWDCLATLCPLLFVALGEEEELREWMKGKMNVEHTIHGVKGGGGGGEVRGSRKTWWTEAIFTY